MVLRERGEVAAIAADALSSGSLTGETEEAEVAEESNGRRMCETVPCDQQTVSRLLLPPPFSSAVYWSWKRASSGTALPVLKPGETVARGQAASEEVSWVAKRAITEGVSTNGKRRELN